MENKIITSADLQNKYLDFYRCMMQYLWDIRVVENLAHLEIAIYERFPDKSTILRYLNLLRPDIKSTYTELDSNGDHEFKDSFETLVKYTEQYDDPGLELYGVKEYVDIQDDNEIDNDLISSKRKMKIKIKKITKTSNSEPSDSEFSLEDEITEEDINYENREE
jgi:hypothetical protein